MPAIVIGWALSRCAGLVGFSAVCVRAKKGEASAFSELVVAATLVDVGMRPQFEPSIDGKHPDLLIEFDGINVYAEVIHPDTSAQRSCTEKLTADVSNRILEIPAACNVDVLLDRHVSADEVTTLIEAIRAAIPSTEIQRHTDFASFLKAATEPNAGIIGSSKIPHPPGSLIGYSARVRAGPDGRAAVVVGAPVPQDRRAHRLLGAELHHFSRDEHNMIVVATTAAGGNACWRELALRWFQPTRNTRVGAILLYEAAIVSDRAERVWQLVQNPWARRPLPDAALATFQSLSGDPRPMA
jgi:hypothetical protein